MKRTSFSTLLTAVVIMAGLSINSMGAVNQISYIVHYNDTPEIGTDTLGGVTYSTVTYGDLFNDGEAGKPSLPVDYLRFSVPYNATNFSVTTTWRINVSHNLSHLLYPCQAPRWMNDTTPIQITLPDTAAYYSGNNYPSQMAWVVDEGFLAGENHIVTVAVMPFSYSHTTTSDQVYQKKKITLMLNYELIDSLAIYPIFTKDSVLREEGYRLTQSMVVNPNQVASFSYSYNPPGPIGPGGPINPNGSLSGGDGLNGELNPGEIQPGDPGSIGFGGDLQLADSKFRYLIVTTNEFRHSLRRLAALKMQKGYSVKIVTIDEVLADSCASQGDLVKRLDGTYYVSFNDPPGKLRQYLKNCRENNGTKYVLLAGTSIPYRHKESVAISGNTQETIDCISDFYYSELNSDWSDSTIKDHAPDLFVGRILAKESAQIDNYTNKLFQYELNPGRGNYSYLRKVLLENGEGFLPGLSSFKDHIFNVFPINKKIELIESHTNFRPTGKEVIDTLNNTPVGLITIFNHGDTTKTAVYADEFGRYHFIKSISTATSGNGLNCLSNRDYPMVFYSPACQTVPFDNRDGINMGESFTTGKDYGGPVYMGYTRKVLTGTTSFITGCFAERLSDGYFTLGKADALSVWDNKYYILQNLQDPSLIHAYIGDPLVDIWTAIPHLYRSIYVTRTDHSINISGIDTDSTIVTYCDNDYIFKQTVNSYNVSLNCSPNASVMIYRHNCIPYIIPTVLQNVNLFGSKYMIAGDFMAGNSVDSIRTNGDVIVKQGANYEIEAAGTTRLCGGFQVELGASFSVIPSSFEDEQYLY